MWIYNLNTETCKPATVLHFGSGLIGHAIWKYVTKLNPEVKQSKQIPYYWGNEEKRFNQIWESIFQSVEQQNTKELHIIWAAGKAGFSAKTEDTKEELIHFRKVLNTLDVFLKEKEIATHFYIMSSAGGIHEGIRMINNPDNVSLKRPYGELKYAQENSLREAKMLTSVSIFRISSVYSHSNVSGRLGLISVLIKNGISNKVSNIFGAERTLRDYVLDDDIAKCVYLNIIKVRRKGVHIEYLVDGKPSSLNEIRLMVEKAVGRKLYLQYSLQKSNATDITFAPEMQSPLFNPSPLYTNIKLLYQNLLKGNFSSHYG